MAPVPDAHTSSDLPPIPAPARVLALGICGLMGLSAVVVFIAGALHAPPAWFLLMFEAAIAVAAVMGVLTARGRFAMGPALALVCVTGCFLVGSYLSYLGAGKRLYRLDLTPLVAARLILSLMRGGTAAGIVLARKPGRSLPLFARGAACAIVVVAMLGATWLLRGRLAALPGLVAGALAIVGFVVFTGFLAAGVHLLISAFETGRPETGATGGAGVVGGVGGAGATAVPPPRATPPAPPPPPPPGAATGQPGAARSTSVR
jgi:hypothetical protein